MTLCIIVNNGLEFPYTNLLPTSQWSTVVSVPLQPRNLPKLIFAHNFHITLALQGFKENCCETFLLFPSESRAAKQYFEKEKDFLRRL